MAEERLVESIPIKSWPNSHFNWYEKVSTWLGRVSCRYEIIVRNRNVYVTTVSNVGENPVTSHLRNRIIGICRLLNETKLSNVEEGTVPFLTSRKVVEAINLFKHLHLFNNNGVNSTDWMSFKLLLNGVPNSINGSDPFVVREIDWHGHGDSFFYTFEYYGRQGVRKDYIHFSNSYQKDAVLTLIRAAIMCTVEEGGAFGHIDFTNVPTLVEKAKKYGIIKIIPDVEYDFLPWSENQRHFQYRRKCLDESN